MDLGYISTSLYDLEGIFFVSIQASAIPLQPAAAAAPASLFRLMLNTHSPG